MYFKDSFSQEAKGFDAVHVSQDSLTLWLGETKFYKAWKTKGVVKGGIDELVEDLKKHITKDYLSEQYVIIKRGLETQLEHPQREEWIEKLSRPILLKDVFQYIRIPLLCIYEDDIALDYDRFQALRGPQAQVRHRLRLRDQRPPLRGALLSQVARW